MKRGQRHGRYNVEPASVEQFFNGDNPLTLFTIPDRCPRCGGLLQREPALLYCRWGCTRIYPIHGASITEQREYETKSGLAKAPEAERTVRGRYAGREKS